MTDYLTWPYSCCLLHSFSMADILRALSFFCYCCCCCYKQDRFFFYRYLKLCACTVWKTLTLFTPHRCWLDENNPSHFGCKEWSRKLTAERFIKVKCHWIKLVVNVREKNLFHARAKDNFFLPVSQRLKSVV